VKALLPDGKRGELELHAENAKARFLRTLYELERRKDRALARATGLKSEVPVAVVAALLALGLLSLEGRWRRPRPMPSRGARLAALRRAWLYPDRVATPPGSVARGIGRKLLGVVLFLLVASVVRRPVLSQEGKGAARGTT
jgi:hypothetical protein